MHPKNMKARSSDKYTNKFLSDYMLADIFSDIFSLSQHIRSSSLCTEIICVW
jgi:hypothetical protein